MCQYQLHPKACISSVSDFGVSILADSLLLRGHYFDIMHKCLHAYHTSLKLQQWCEM